MSLDPVKNFSVVTVSTGYDDSATTVVLSASEGAKLPATHNYNVIWFNFTDHKNPSDDPNVEIVRVTARTTDTLTVTRAQEGTSAATHNTGGKTYKMMLGITAKMITDIDAAYIPKALFDAYTILMATTDDTPAALTVTEQTLIGRITGGAIAALSIAQIRTLLGISASGASLIDDADVATMLATLGAMSNADATVTYAKMQHVSATAKVLGRVTAGAGDVEEIVIDADLSSVSANDDTVPSAKATKAMGDLKLPLAGGTMSGNITLGELTAVALDPAGSADEKWSGITVAGTAGATLAVGDLCYLDVTAAEWLLTDADAAATAGPVVLGICILAAGNGQATNMLLMGTVRSAAFPASIALGAPLFVSGTAGDVTETMPTGANAVVRIVGWAVTVEPNTLYFCPSPDYITRVS